MTCTGIATPAPGDRTPAALIGRRRLAALAVVALLAACGGGSTMGVGGEGTGSSRDVVGRIDGFGSVIVAGTRYDDGDARLFVEIDPRAEQERSLSDLRVGMDARMTVIGGRVRELHVAPELRAAVSDVVPGEGLVIAAGQRVLIDASTAEPTTFDGLAGLEDLDSGDIVEVYGQRDAQGRVRATHVARRPAGSDVRVVGTAREVDTGTGTLAIDGLVVQFASAARMPAAFVPRDGDRVTVFGSMAAVDAALVAAVIAEPQKALRDGVDAALEGAIHEAAAGPSFVVRGARVDASAASIEGGTPMDLTEGRSVWVEGPVAGGTVRATRVRIVPTDSPLPADVTAAITDFVDSGRFRLRGLDVSAAAASFEGLGPTNLGNGVRIRVTGLRQGGALVASTVRAEPASDGDAFVRVGTVIGFDPDARTFEIAGTELSLTLAPDVVFVDGTADRFGDGVAVSVRGSLDGGAAVVREVRFSSAQQEYDIAGIGGDAEGTAVGGSFQIGETHVDWDASTVFLGPTGTFADLANGQYVRVKARLVAGVLRATRVDAQPTMPGTVVVRGSIEEPTGGAQFRIGGQRVDAAIAVFEPPTLATSPAGAYVDVEGTLVDGVLRATRVSEP